MENYNLHREIPIVDEYDVIVVGGGPSGITASVSSSRLGAKTVLVERYGMLGGNLSSGYITPILGTVSDGTIVDEVLNLLNGRRYDIERAKSVLPGWVVDSRVELMLQAPIVDVIMDGRKINGIIISTNSGLKALLGKVVIDSTGNGIVSYLSDLEYKQGRECDGLMQPATLMFKISGVDERKATFCFGVEDDVKVRDKKLNSLCQKAIEKGELPENVGVVRLFPSNRKGERIINATQANYIDPGKLSDLTKAELDLRKQINMVVSFLKNNVPGYEKCYLIDSADTLGIRESRRFIGEYIIKGSDILKGRKFDDVIVHSANFMVDIHNPDGAGQAEGKAGKAKPYDIPYRVFLPKDIENLFLNGRCISGTHQAHASYRVMAICMAMGQGVGIASSLSVKSDTSPKNLNYKKVQRVLQECGVNLFN